MSSENRFGPLALDHESLIWFRFTAGLLGLGAAAVLWPLADTSVVVALLLFGTFTLLHLALDRFYYKVTLKFAAGPEPSDTDVEELKKEGLKRRKEAARLDEAVRDIAGALIATSGVILGLLQLFQTTSQVSVRVGATCLVVSIILGFTRRGWIDVGSDSDDDADEDVPTELVVLTVYLDLLVLWAFTLGVTCILTAILYQTAA